MYTKAIHSLIGLYEPKAAPVSDSSGVTFQATLEALKKNNSTTIQDMTMAQYKEYVHDKIRQLLFQSSQLGGFLYVHISEAGFDAMKKDPEYEKWVFDYIKDKLNYQVPWHENSIQIMNFTDKKETYHETNFYKTTRLFNTPTRYSSQDRRAKRREELEKILIFCRYRRALLEKIAKNRYIKRQNIEEQLKAKAIMEEFGIVYPAKQYEPESLPVPPVMYRF